PPRPPREPGWRPRVPWPAVAIAAVVLVAVLAIVVLPGGSGGGGSVAGHHAPHSNEGENRHAKAPPTPRSGVSVRLAAGAEVWVCVLDAKGQRLVDGQILEAGAEEGPFHSGSFTVSFGNGEITMMIDGRQAEIPATSSPIGYSIDASGKLTELS